MGLFAALLGGLLALASLAGAQAPPAPVTGPHLLVVPDTPRADAALERSDARVLARYGDFTLVEATGADEDALRRGGAYRRDDLRRVSLPGGRIDPLRRESLAGKGSSSAREELVLVQFIGPVKDSWLGALRDTGARIVHHVPQNGYLVHARGGALGRLAALVGAGGAVRAATPLRPGDKLAVGAGARAVSVQTVAGAPGARARSRVSGAGEELRPPSLVSGVRTLFARLPSIEIDALAADPGVVGIGPYAEPELHDERAAQIVAGNIAGDLPSGPGYLNWLEGEGFATKVTFDFAIDVTDSGLDTGSAAAPGHPDFREDGAGASRVAYASDYTAADPDARDCGGHGTNVASIAAGFGTTGANRQDGDGFRHGMGIAPRAQVGASKIFACDGKFDRVGTITDVAAAAYADGSRISNNSWGTSLPGEYTVESAELDALVRDAQPLTAGQQQMVEVFSAGNDGDEVDGLGNEGYASISSQGSAKNVITVGASESPRAIGGTDGCGVSDTESDDPEDIINFSSRGPTDDGRLKPDLVAPGTHIVGAAPQHSGYAGFGTCNASFPSGNPFYSLVSGTSQAAPQVAGAAALIRDWYRREHGGGTAVPSPALTKALLVNTARDIAGGATGKGSTITGVPNADQGWGRVDLGAVLDGTARELHDQVDLLTGSGDSVTRSYSIQDAGEPLKVTLAWTDAPGLPDTDAFANDLDLTVVAGGRRFRGNVLSGGRSVPGGVPDHRNNVESVYLPAGLAGPISVEVLGAAITDDGVPGADPTDQDFALVVSNAIEQPTPALVGGGDLSIDDPAPGGDDDATLESGEQAELGVPVENAGTVSATSVTGVLVGSGGLTVGAPGSSGYPNIAAGDVQENASPFVGQLANSFSCGADAEATLTISTAGPAGTHAIPLTLPTGEVGSPLASDASGAGLPVTISDESPLGASSSVFVAERGRVKDVDVRVAELDHTWVGDLVVELTGPDGTTVVLAEHPGGPDNQTDNPNTGPVENQAFLNTVFDDEAAGPIGAGSEPYSGSFKPYRDQLSRFDGKDRRGTWTLRVRDLFEGDTGRLSAWGLTSRKAVCDFDSIPPETSIAAGPGSPVAQSTASFAFSSADPSAGFECRLDGAAYEPCASPKGYSGVATGTHTFQVRAVDGSGNEDPSPAAHTWAVDVTPPETVITGGPSGVVRSTEASFGFSSEAGAGFECELDGGGFAPCSSPKLYASLDESAHAFQVRARDALGNVDPTPAIRTWRVDLAAPPAPSLVMAPAEQDMGAALSGRLAVLAACTSSCSASATVTVSARMARRLGIATPAGARSSARSVRLGRRSRVVAAGGTASLGVRLSRSARAALRSRSSAKLQLRVRVAGRGRTMAFKRTLSLRRRGRLGRMLRSGLPVWAACSESCRLTGRLSLSRREARRLGLSVPRRAARFAVATGRASGGRAGTRTLVRVRRAVRSRLSRAARVSGLLELTARAGSGAERRFGLPFELKR